MRISRVDNNREDIRHTLNMLDQECFPADELCEKTGWWWIVYDDTKAIGFAGLKLRKIEPNVGYLCRVGILPKYRGRGLQKRLIRVRVNHARRHDLTHLITDTTENPASANSLIRCGFKMYNPLHAWASENSLYWMLEL